MDHEAKIEKKILIIAQVQISELTHSNLLIDFESLCPHILHDYGLNMDLYTSILSFIVDAMIMRHFKTMFV